MDLDNALEDFLEAGTRLVWFLYPELSQANCVQPSGKMDFIRKKGPLNTADVFPGVAIEMEQVFANARQACIQNQAV